MRICHLYRRSIWLRERKTNKLAFSRRKNKTSRPQSMASAVSTAGSSASSLLYFICTETASLSRHAAQSAAGHQSSLRRVFAFGNIFFGADCSYFSQWTGWRLRTKDKVHRSKRRGRDKRVDASRGIQTERERHAHQFCGFCVLHRLSAASVCGEKEEASLVWNITPPPPTPSTPTQYFHHLWITDDLPLTWKERALPFCHRMNASWHLMSQIPTTHHRMELNLNLLR